MTKIEWTDETWNPLAGCSLVSPGCTNCYAMGHAHRLLDKPGSHYHGTTRKVNGKAVWTGKIARAPDHIMQKPLRWTRPRMVFVNSMSDLFHEDVPDETIDEVFAIMALASAHTFQVLTKRAERMREYMNYEHTPARITAAMFEVCKRAGIKIDECTRPDLFDADGFATTPVKFPLDNVWLGVSVEDQRRANERIRHLLNTTAAIRFLSMEPLVGGVDLNSLTSPAIKDDAQAVPLVNETCLYHAGDRPAILPMHDTNKIDWVIVGGESGHSARPMHPDWAHYLKDQCVTAGVPFFFKQWGEYAPLGWKVHKDQFAMDLNGNTKVSSATFPEDGWTGMDRVGKKKAGRRLGGEEWNQMPERKGL